MEFRVHIAAPLVMTFFSKYVGNLLSNDIDLILFDLLFFISEF